MTHFAVNSVELEYTCTGGTGQIFATRIPEVVSEALYTVVTFMDLQQT